MIFIDTCIDGLKVIEPTVHANNYISYRETYNEKIFYKHGITTQFVQDNQSMSKFGVLRGVHVQKNFPQAKIVRVLKGAIWDVAVDMRPESDTYGSWFGIELTSDNCKQLYLPENFAHGFLTLSDEAEVFMKVSDFYHPGDEIGFKWNDNDIGIEWPIDRVQKIILADKDKNWKSFVDTFIKY